MIAQVGRWQSRESVWHLVQLAWTMFDIKSEVRVDLVQPSREPS
jgi:hypothetical protein